MKDNRVKGKIAERAPLIMKASFDGNTLRIEISDNIYDKGVQADLLDQIPDDISCGPLLFDLYFYPRDAAKAGDGRLASYYRKVLRGVDIGDFLNQHSGVYLYRDGAWVKPIGGKNDWLGLEARRVQRRSRLGLSQIYGIVRISQEKNPDIRSTAHRETIQDNSAYKDMRRVILRSVEVLEKYRDEKKDEKKQDQGTHPPDKIVENNIKSLDKSLKGNRDVLSPDAYQKMNASIKAIKQNQKLASEARNQESKKSDELRSHRDAVAAIGLLTSYMAHEVATSLDCNVKLLAHARRVIDAEDDSMLDTTEYEGWLQSLEANTALVLHFVGLVNSLSKHIAASVARDGKPVELDVSEVWAEIAGGLKDLTDSHKINVETHANGNIRVSSSRMDLEAILANLFLNSVEALRAKTSGMRRILFDAEYSKDGLRISVSDNGKGVPRDYLERIFEPFVTASGSGDGAAHGHGLGLAIVKELVERHCGKVQAESPAPMLHGEGTTVTISFPRDSVPGVAVVR